MGWLKKESAYERRMRELDEEAERVRKSMHQLMKGSHREVAARVESAPASGIREASPLQRPPAYRKTADFRTTAEASPASPEQDPEPTSESATAFDTASSSPLRPERLASYLASGSFGKSGSLSRERKIQRNKAVVMLILAVIAMYSLYVWLY